MQVVRRALARVPARRPAVGPHVVVRRVVLDEGRAGRHVEQVAHGRLAERRGRRLGHVADDRRVEVEQPRVGYRAGEQRGDGLGHAHHDVRLVGGDAGRVPLQRDRAVAQDHEGVAAALREPVLDAPRRAVRVGELELQQAGDGGVWELPHGRATAHARRRDELADVAERPAVAGRRHPVGEGRARRRRGLGHGAKHGREPGPAGGKPQGVVASTPASAASSARRCRRTATCSASTSLSRRRETTSASAA